MRFADHSDLKGLHAFLSASKYSWVNYDPEKLDTYCIAPKTGQLSEGEIDELNTKYLAKSVTHSISKSGGWTT